jgi:HPt (histidine-containing phosphotransfer) domain-containing protein
MVQAAGTDPASQIEAGIARVRARFIAMLEDRADELYDLLDYLDDVSVRDVAYKEIQSRAHKLHGISGSVGFPRVGELAAKLEATIVLARSEERSRNVQQVRRQMDELLEEMEQCLNGE